MHEQRLPRAWVGHWSSLLPCANSVTEDWHDLKAMAKDAVFCHFDEDRMPRVIRLHLVREGN